MVYQIVFLIFMPLEAEYCLQKQPQSDDNSRLLSCFHKSYLCTVVSVHKKDLSLLVFYVDKGGYYNNELLRCQFCYWNRYLRQLSPELNDFLCNTMR